MPDDAVQKELEAEAADMVSIPSHNMSAEETEEALKAEGQPEVKPEGAPPETPTTPETPVATPEHVEGQAIPNEVLKALEETPFKSVPDVVKGYKNVQSEFTRVKERVKPWEQLINDAETDRNFGNFMQQAAMMYKNPQLAAAYATPSGAVSTPPDPRNYDMFDTTQYQKYQQDLASWNARELDGRLNARFADVEQRQQLDKMKYEFKQAYPNGDPDSVLKWYKEKGPWTLLDVYKAMNYDNLKSEALNEARREITTQMEKARTTKTPASSSAASEAVKVQDVLDFITRHGGAAARKKFGDAKFADALRQDADNFMR